MEMVHKLLLRPPLSGPQIRSTPTLESCVDALRRRSGGVVERAGHARVSIEYMGIHPLFSHPRYYRGKEADWILGPALGGDDLVVPRREGRALRRLVDANVDFPMVFIGHETDGRGGGGGEAIADGDEVSREAAARLVGPVPPPIGSVALGERLTAAANEAMGAILRALPVLVRFVKGPLDLTEEALAVRDPIVLGAIPAMSGRPGEPAAWYLLAQWDW